MTLSMTRYFTLPILFLLAALSVRVSAQCPNDNALYNVPATPPCPGSIVVNCMWGGEYVIVNVVAGNIYTFSTCGGAGWDTEITLYTNTGVLVGSNDDGCGLESTVSWIATYTGPFHVLLDSWWLGLFPCEPNSSCANLTVSCSSLPDPGGCSPGLGGETINGSGSIGISQILTPTQLVSDVFLGDCLTASNIQFTGSTAAIGTFTNGWRLGINSGIVLTTGSAGLAIGPNVWADEGMDNLLPGNSLLTNLVGAPTYDATVLQFTFVPQSDQVTFTYVFASEEYPEYVCAQVNDVFGFFVSGPGYAPNTNIATVPGATWLPVAINSVNPGSSGIYGDPLLCSSLSNAAFYVSNTGGAHNEYDGFSVPLTACITTVPCETYTLTIAIADVWDGIYDSAVFLEAESFTAGVDLEIDANSGSQASSPENCADQGAFVFTIDQPMDETVVLTYTVSQAGGAVFSPPIPVTVTFPPGVTTVTIPISAVIGTLGVDVTSITIELDTSQNPTLGCSCTSEVVTATLYFCDPLLPVTWLDFQATLAQGQDAVLCTWRTAAEMNNDHFTVERSGDGTAWHAIGVLPGAGNSNTPLSYEFVDQAPLPGVSYYKIRQTDHNGAMDHSEVRSVRRNGQGAFSAYPNPGTGTFMLTGHQDGTITVHDLSGRKIGFTLTTEGEMQLHNAAAGSYMIELKREQGTEPERIRVMVH